MRTQEYNKTWMSWYYWKKYSTLTQSSLSQATSAQCYSLEVKLKTPKVFQQSYWIYVVVDCGRRDRIYHSLGVYTFCCSLGVGKLFICSVFGKDRYSSFWLESNTISTTHCCCDLTRERALPPPPHSRSPLYREIAVVFVCLVFLGGRLFLLSFRVGRTTTFFLVTSVVQRYALAVKRSVEEFTKQCQAAAMQVSGTGPSRIYIISHLGQGTNHIFFQYV